MALPSVAFLPCDLSATGDFELLAPGDLQKALFAGLKTPRCEVLRGGSRGAGPFQAVHHAALLDCGQGHRA